MPECPHGGPAMGVVGSETHSNGSTDHYEIRSASPFQPNFDGSQLPGERLPGESGRYPSAQIPAPAGRAAIWVAAPTECLPPRPETACLYRPIRTVQSFAR